MELWVYTREMVLAGIVESATSLLWTRKYHEPGDFELHCPLTPSNVEIIKQDNLVTYPGAREAGIIEGLKLTESMRKKTIVAKGRFLSSYLDRRLITGDVTVSGTVESVMAQLISRCTAIPRLSIAAAEGFTEEASIQASNENLLTRLKLVSVSSGLGFRVAPDFAGRKMEFQVYKGVDRSEMQTENNRVIFSDVYNNLGEETYTYSSEQSKTYAVVEGTVELKKLVMEFKGKKDADGSMTWTESEKIETDKQDRVIKVGGGEGLDLREVYVKGGNISEKDALTDDEIKTLSMNDKNSRISAKADEVLRQKGLDALAKYAAASAFDFTVLADGNFKYKSDYDLGDIVTVSKEKWGMNESKRITEIREIYEHRVMEVDITFGNALSEQLDSI